MAPTSGAVGEGLAKAPVAEPTAIVDATATAAALCVNVR